MRLLMLCLASVVITAAASVNASGQQSAASTEIPVQSAVQPTAAAPDSRKQEKDAAAEAKAQAKAAEKAQKDKDKAEAKARKEEEKAKKEAEKDATYLKLQNNEIVASSFDENGNPVKLPPCARKDKECQAKRKEFLKQKKVNLRVENGTLTVDGWTGKARLNYDVKNFRFLYVSVPSYGTIVASPERFQNSTEMKNAIDGKTITITTADNHTVQLAGDETIAGKQKRSMFFVVDQGFTRPGRFPTVGYGFVSKQPYSWPGTLPPTEKQKQLMAKAPPLPQGLELKEMTVACQNVAPGELPKPIKVNGVIMTPPACRSTATPGAFRTGERPPDGAGAASTGIAEAHPPR